MLEDDGTLELELAAVDALTIVLLPYCGGIAPEEDETVLGSCEMLPVDDAVVLAT